MKASIVRLYVLRHGEPENTRMFYGHRDVGLSEQGRQHVRAQRSALAHLRFSEIHTSDLQRAWIGAEALAGDGGVQPQRASELREMHLGCLEGLLHEEARERYPELATRSYLDMLDVRMPAGGESVRDTAQRAQPYVEAVMQRAWAQSDDSAILLYAHNTINRILLGLAAGCGAAGFGRFMQRYGAINRIDVAQSEPGRDVWSGATIVFSNWDPRHPCP